MPGFPSPQSKPLTSHRGLATMETSPHPTLASVSTLWQRYSHSPQSDMLYPTWVTPWISSLGSNTTGESPFCRNSLLIFGPYGPYLWCELLHFPAYLVHIRLNCKGMRERRQRKGYYNVCSVVNLPVNIQFDDLG